MTSEEFEELVLYTKKRFVEDGLSSIADDANYLDESDELRELPAAKDQIELMLLALERHLASLDRDTYQVALQNVKEACGLKKMSPPVVVYARRRDSSPGSSALSLKAAPKFRGLRRRVYSLIRDLQETPSRRSGE